MARMTVLRALRLSGLRCNCSGRPAAPRAWQFADSRFRKAMACEPSPKLAKSLAESAIEGASTQFASANPDYQAQTREDIQVVLVEPQIPQNTGNAARTCAATRVGLHLVGPLAFELDSAKLRRAGLDYWPFVCVDVHQSWAAFLDAFDSRPGPKRLVAYSKFATTHYAVDNTYKPGDWLLFGSETHGLPDGAAQQIADRGGLLVKIPMDCTFVRSLNLSVSVGIGLYEALRQLDAPVPGVVLSKQIDQS